MKLYHINILLISLIGLISSGCSTGIENTKTIRYSKTEKREIAPSPEEALLSDISGVSLKDWKPGRRFLISDNRAAVVFESTSPLSVSSEPLKGKLIKFREVRQRITPGGESQAVLVFEDDSKEYLYPSGKRYKDALENISSLDVPMLIDLETVEAYRDRLKGLSVWSRSSLWYDEKGEKFQGRRFVPLKIVDVSPGDLLFMIHLSVIDENGENAVIYMNPVYRGMESRTFPSLFCLSDPKLHHQSIRPEIWELIRNERVCEGMTKEECKLALGNPDDVSTGHDWNQTIDIWTYKNGTFLQFQDGLLTRFRM